MFCFGASTFATFAAVLTAGALVVTGAVAETTLRFVHFSVEDDPNHRAAENLAQMVADATNGEVAIRIAPNSQLGGELDVVEGILLGPSIWRPHPPRSSRTG